MISFVLTYFDIRRGPTVYLSVPANSLDNELIKKIESFMDLDFGESIFEINLHETNFKTFNHLIELPSQNSRGYVESFLLSIIADKNYNSKKMFQFLKNVNNEFLSCMEFVDDISKSHKKLEVMLASFRARLMDILKEYNTEENINNVYNHKNYGEEQGAISLDYLQSNLQNLVRNIAGKNEFRIKKFALEEQANGHFSIQMKLKGGGFLTRPLKKMTYKSVRDGLEKYMVSNGIEKEDFSIEIQ